MVFAAVLKTSPAVSWRINRRASSALFGLVGLVGLVRLVGFMAMAGNAAVIESVTLVGLESLARLVSPVGSIAMVVLMTIKLIKAANMSWAMVFKLVSHVRFLEHFVCELRSCKLLVMLNKLRAYILFSE